MAKKIKISELNTNLFVRHALDQDHALYLAELIENGVKLPPIKITRSKEIVDGRHRVEGHELNNLDEIEYEYEDFKSREEMIAAAYKANVGGPLPPTAQDTEHTVSLLIESGETIKHIAELLSLPSSLARKYVQTVKSKVSRVKMQKAIAAVTDGGLTVAKAAEKHDVDPDSLKETLAGTRRKNRQGVPEIRRKLTFEYKSLSSKNAALLRSLRDQFEDGDVTAQNMKDIFTQIKSLQRKGVRMIADWEKRFNTKSK